MKRAALLMIVLGALPLLAAAEQAIWRCGSSYSATPCAQGRAVEAMQARPDADVQAAQKVAEREKRLAEQMRNERLRQETAASRQGAAGIYASAGATSTAGAQAPRKPKKPHPQAKPRPSEEDGTLRAAVQATRRTKG